MKFIKAALLALVFSGVANAADLKIGVVDLNKVFGEFHKAKELAETLEANKTKAREEINERVAAMKKLNDEVEKAAKAAQDPVLGESERAKSRATAQTKAQELRSLERDIQEFGRRREGQIQQQLMEQRRELSNEIVNVVKEVAKTKNYDLVFDQSGMSVAALPFMLYSKEGVTDDFTQAVIETLNTAAPAAAAEKK